MDLGGTPDAEVRVIAYSHGFLIRQVNEEWLRRLAQWAARMLVAKESPDVEPVLQSLCGCEDCFAE